ncbi:MAG: hypothetical protein R3A47_07825 [Polyangiales bacterium]
MSTTVSTPARAVRIGPIIVFMFFLIALIGPWIAPYDPSAIDLSHEFEPPSSRHWLGTGDNGVDILSALLHGTQLAAEVSSVVIAVSVAIGMLLGIAAAYWGKYADEMIMGVTDLVQAFPSIVLNIAVLALVAEPGVVHSS